MNAKVKNGKIHVYRYMPKGYVLCPSDFWDTCLCGIKINETNAILTTEKYTCKNCSNIIRNALKEE